MEKDGFYINQPVIHDLPMVSVLMTTYNCKEQVFQTLSNIIEQDYPKIQIVIADGGSKDGTVDIIRYFAVKIKTDFERLENRQFHIKWISEPDQGIYDAMNKAYRMSDGDIIAICNDRYTRPDAISMFVNKLLETEKEQNKKNNQPEDWYLTGVHSDLIYVDGKICKRLWRMGKGNGNIHFGWMPAHPTLFLRRQVYETYGLYDISYRISADYDFMLRILKDKRVKLGYIPEILISMFFGGTSNGGGGLGYLSSVWEAYLALLRNRIAFPFTALVCRIIRTFGQYQAAKDYRNNEQ